MGEAKESPESPRIIQLSDDLTDISSNVELPPTTKALAAQNPLLFVVLDCVHYVAGERVTGEILLDLEDEFPASVLVLKSSGKEEVGVYDVDKKAGRKEAMSQVYTLEYTIKEWTDVTPAGQFVFPFSFKLPQYCPATFSFQGDDSLGNYMKGDISYSVTAQLRVLDSSDRTLSHSRPMLLRNARSQSKVNASTDLHHIVQGCCCTTRGSTELHLSIKNEEHCAVSGHVKFKLDPDNSHCAVPINHITGIVTQEVVFMIPGFKEFRYVHVISSVSRATWINTSTSMIYDKDFEYYAELRMASRDSNPSSNDTPLIRSVFTVEAQVHYDLSCGNETASVFMPLHVDPRNSLERLEPTLPKKWNPVENAIINIVVETSSRTVSADMLANIQVPS